MKENSNGCMSLCLNLIQEASSRQRSNIAVQTLINSYNSTSPSSLSSASTSLSNSNNENNNRMITENMSQQILSACLNCVSNNNNDDHNKNNENGIIKSRVLLPILLRIQTVHTGNVPEKGTTVWYLQQKSTEINDVLEDTSENSIEEHSSNITSTANIIENSRSRTIRTVHRIEALEGKLVGIHKEGKEEPYYTVSLSTPINGSAGNTVREIQTNGFR